MELTEFLRARLDEEAALIEVMRDGGFPSETWVTEPARNPAWLILRDEDDPTPIAYIRDSRCEYKHIARHDPARVLREVEAKRAIMDHHAPVRHEGRKMCGSCLAVCTYWPCPTVRHLAAVWSDHPDYDPAWRA